MASIAMGINKSLRIISFSFLLFQWMEFGCFPGKRLITFHPKVIDSTLVNPGRGFTTTGKSYNESLIVRGARHPLSGVVQQRFYWDKLEPEEGKINFALIDSLLEQSGRNGQQLNFRIMCQGGDDMRIPEWAMNKGITQPYYDNPVFLAEHKKLIHALAYRYDGHPNLAFVDIGTVGQWAEWHTEQSKVKMPVDTNAHKIIDMYIDNFTMTPLAMLIGAGEPLEYALSRAAGWRADCWGDMGEDWSHMRKRYPEFFSKAPHIKNAWKYAPVALETCWTMRYWFEQGWDIDYILKKALEWHATEVNNGTEDIPDEWWSKIVEFEKRLGYRFVLEEMSYPGEAKTGSELHFSMKWKNVGVAPVYQKYPLAIRLVSAKNKSFLKIIKTEADLTQWLPGENQFKSKINIPGDLPAGAYELEIGILGLMGQEPFIKIAIEGRTPDGWYPAGSIILE